MKDLIYAKINSDKLNDNIKKIKELYKYEHYILDVSNNAFSHGMFLINYLNQEIDTLYTCNFQDVLLIRKYNKDIKIIYSGVINEDNIYDLILNSAILVIKRKKTIDWILKLKIKDKFEIIFNIDTEQYNGIHDKHTLDDIIEELKCDVHIHIAGIIARVKEKDYLDFKYITTPLDEKLEYIILNDEHDKNKIKTSNAIKLDTSVYGVDTSKKRFFIKNYFPYQPILEVFAKPEKIVKKINRNKEYYTIVIPFGKNHGMISTIKYVYINNKRYKIKEISNEYTIISGDASIKKEDLIEIIGSHSSLKSFQDISYITSNLTFMNDDYIL